METTPALPALRRITRFELPLCQICNRVANRRVVAFFVLVSRLGDGWLWLAVTFLVAACGAVAVVAQLLLVGAASYGLYKALKERTARPRPCDSDAGIDPLAAPVDRFSFPSGHTLHAVAFTVVLVTHYPPLGWVVVPFTVLVAASRLVLGLHYPSDVLAGALVGTAVSALSFQL